MASLWTTQEEQRLYDFIKNNLTEKGKINWHALPSYFSDRTINQAQAKYFRMRQETDQWNFKFMKIRNNKRNHIDTEMTIQNKEQFLIDDILRILAISQ